MAAEIPGMRAQILANAKIMLKSTTTGAATACACPSSSSAIRNCSSQSTLIPPPSLMSYYGDLDVVVFGRGTDFTAALMAGLTPAIEGDRGASPEGALRKLLFATAEMLVALIPKVGAHQRNIHGGGVFDEDMISGEILEAQRTGH